MDLYCSENNTVEQNEVQGPMSISQTVIASSSGLTLDSTLDPGHLKPWTLNLGLLSAEGVILREGVCGVGGDDVTDPTQCAAATNPESGSDDQPENTRQNSAVVELPDARNNEAKKTSGKWIAHDS